MDQEQITREAAQSLLDNSVEFVLIAFNKDGTFNFASISNPERLVFAAAVIQRHFNKVMDLQGVPGASGN